MEIYRAIDEVGAVNCQHEGGVVRQPKQRGFSQQAHENNISKTTRGDLGKRGPRPTNGGALVKSHELCQAGS